MLKCLSVRIVCALRWEVTFVGFTLPGMTHPIQNNIIRAGLASVDGSHPGPQG